MNKIPTAKEFRKSHTTTANINSNKEAEICMIKFAKLHVKAALREAAEKAEIRYLGSKMYIVDKESIIESYILEKIK